MSSKSSQRRHSMKESDPHKYARELEHQNSKYHEAKRARLEYWASGTRQAQEDKEAYYAKRRMIDRKSRLKQKQEKGGGRQTRTSALAINAPRRVDRKSMTDEERKAHDNEKRRQARANKSRQKRTAEKAAAAKYMQQYRLKKKLERGAVHNMAAPTMNAGPSTPVDPVKCKTLPIHQSTPIPSSEGPSPVPDIWTSPPRMRPAKSATSRSRQHVYNTCAQFKSTLKKSFTEDEATKMSVNLFMRKTPEKKKQNLDKLIEHPEVRTYFRRKLNMTAPPSKTTMLPQKSRQKSTRKVLQDRWKHTKSEIHRFYRNPSISRILPHRRFATKSGPGFALLTTLRQAHTIFQEKSGKAVAFSLFAKERPKYVRKLGSVPVETCLCVSCTNVKLKIEALNRHLGPERGTIPREGSIFKFVLCPFKGPWPRKDCISGDCLKCRDRIRPFTLRAWDIYEDEVQWMRWERRTVEGRMKLDVHPYHGKVSDLLAQLNADLEQPTKGTSFIEHLFNAYWQFAQYAASKDSLRPGQVLMVQDFAENRKATYSGEVKSAHFGKQQVTLHPTVCFFRNGDGQLVRHVVMLFSDDIGHDYHAVHTFTEKTLDIIREDVNIEEAIIWSDGAASQYKGKGTFADLSLYKVKIQRNFFGSDHGKGEADGETGRFSQAMARAVAGGRHFRNAEDMVTFGSSLYETSGLKKYSFVLVKLEDIIRDRPHTNVGTLPGSRSLHQIVRKKPYTLAARKHSCFCSGCLACKYECCINKDYVSSFEIFKLKASAPLDEAFLEDGKSEEEEEDIVPAHDEPLFTNSVRPSVGEYLNIHGWKEIKKGRPRREENYYAVVIPVPEGRSSKHFYVQFYERQASGTYTLASREYEIVPGTAEDYKWRTIEAPTYVHRGHYVF